MAGKNLVSQVPPDRWSQEAFLHPDPKHPGTSYSFTAGTIGDISGFDAAFFGISPREAANMDPQQRLLLELTWEAMENAGILPEALRGSSTAVYIGVSTADYSYRLTDDLGLVDSSTATGNAASILANRISYFYDLKGPSLIVDTACSSSLVAFHHAYQAILTGQTEIAITGGISLHLHPYGFLTFSKASMLSPTGRCHVFDQAADGYVRSEGAGIFILKDYDQAIADNDPILAVVAGSAINTDGHKSSMTVPCANSQAELMRQAYRSARIQPDEIDYLEAHGTGTQVGDPIETAAIGLALGSLRDKPLPIGSIKSNLGHLEAAAGVAGLIKAILTLQKRIIPPLVGLENPNPNIKFKEWNLDAITTPRELTKTGTLNIGINSFGFGGANAHVILQTAPKANPLTEAICRPAKPLPIFLSARSPEALKETAYKLATQLENQSDQSFYDLAWSSRFHRQQLRYCALIEANSIESATEKLLNFHRHENETNNNLNDSYTSKRLDPAHGPVFVYTGNGCQWQLMGQNLIENEPIFRRAVEEIDRFFVPLSGYSLVAELAGGNGQNRFERTEIAQPALFALQVGITQLLRNEGITAKAVTGHSVGEIAAAWASGALTLREAVKVIYYRSFHQGRTKGQGQMTAAGLASNELVNILDEARFASLSLAGANSPRGSTVSGPQESLDVFEKELSRKNIPFKRLDLDYAFHSPAMDSIETSIRLDLAELKTLTTNIPFFSTVTGEQVDGRNLNAEYWWHNIRKPVQFHAAIKNLCDENFNIFVEIGGQPILQNYLKEILRDNDTEGAVLTTISRKESSADKIIETARKVLLAGSDDNLKRWFPSKGNFISLPNYPWQKEHHWFSSTTESLGLLQRHYDHPLLGYPLAQHQGLWQTNLDIQKFPWLADHQVGESVVFPGAGFAELVCAAANLAKPGKITEIEDFEILSPLLLSERSKVVRTRLQETSGKITIESREQDEDSAWRTHLKARIIQDPTEQNLKRLRLKLPKRAPDFTKQEHAIITQRAGLNYGTAFSAITHGWAGEESAIAELQLPEELCAPEQPFFLHPALLDCAFQLSAHLLPIPLNENSGFAYIPIRIDRLHLYNDKQLPCHATARILSKSAYSITAEFALYDTEQRAIALYKGVRFKAIRVKKAAGNQLAFLDYHLTPAPRQSQADLSRISTQLGADLLFAMQLWQQEPCNLRYIQEVEPLLESLTAAYIYAALGKLAGPSGHIPATQLTNCFDECAVTAPLLNYLLTAGVSQGDLQTTEQGWQLRPAEQDDIPADLIWNTLIREYPDYLKPSLSVGRSGLQLKQQLVGQQPSTDLGTRAERYSKEFSEIQKMDFTPFLAKHLNSIITRAKEALADGQRLGIIEIGHQGPLLTEAICNGFDFRTCDYCFASWSEYALDAALTIQKQHPLLSLMSLGENEQNKEASAIDLPGKQLALLHLDLLNPESLISTLSELNKLLAPGAPIILIGHHRSGWLDFILNTTPGESIEQPFTSKQLKRLLEDQQLQLDESFADTVNNGAGPFLLLANRQSSAEKPSNAAAPEQTNWLFICSDSAKETQLAQTLVAGLAAAEQNAEVLSLSTAAELVTKLAEPARSYDQFEQIVHLYGLLDTTDLSAAITRCDIATNIIQFCEASEHSQTLWILTNGMAETFPHDQNRQVESKPLSKQAPTDAAIWGFARSAMNEAGSLEIRLTDLPHELTSAAQLALLDEWLTPSKENELLLSMQGARLAPRLRHEPAPTAPKRSDEPQELVTKLGFSAPGQLRNLRWQQAKIEPPAADEIEVKVVATGLNFRDVMYTLGLLADEALEDGFAGATLGLEFAGLVTRVGAEITTFAAGDAVLGFGPASFSTRLLTKADAVTLLPDHIDLAAAATIPTTFFTAYYALHHLARLQPGEKVLIHGAAGGVGVAAIQIAQWLGAEIYATAGSEEKRDFLKLLGIEKIYDSRSLTFAEEILADTADGQGVDVILNSLAGEAIQRNFRILKPLGRFLEIGKRDFYENSQIGLRPFRNNISYFGIDADQIRLKSPELANRMFKEVIDLFQQNILHPLPYTDFAAAHVEEAFRYMQQAKQIGKIIVTNFAELGVPEEVSTTSMPDRLSLSEKASYLITGGLGGLGLKLAEWLAARGARHLLLVSRRGKVAEEDLPTIQALESQGVTVQQISCDVTERAALSDLIELCGIELPPLKGVIHAATTIEDGLIRNLSGQQLKSGMAAKILGAQHLHELTASLDLDLFVLISSATTLFGNPGQSSYVAANHWLEALAAHRRAKQLPVCCIRLGGIEDVGFLARNQEIKQNLQKRMGGEALHSDRVTEVIEQMLLSDCQSTLACLELDWSTLKRYLPRADALKFAEINAQTDDKNADNSQIDLQQKLTELSGDELHTALVEILSAELSRILLIPVNKIDPARSLYDIGLDSLMGVELIVAIEASLGLSLPVMLLSEAPNLNKLASYIIKTLKGENDSEEQSLQQQVKSTASQHGVETLDDAGLEELTDKLAADSKNQQIIQP